VVRRWRFRPMKLRRIFAALFTAGMGGSLSAASLVREGAMEKIALVSVGDAKAWSPAECTIAASSDHAKAGEASWHWHVTVDHFGGEARYPVGWPRIAHVIPEGILRDWSAWDFLQVWIYVDTSRNVLPKEAAGLGLQTPDRAGAYNRTLGELKKGEWIEIKIQVSQIARAHDVRQIQFHIAESNYRHGDTVDFYLNDLALLRYAEPTLVAVAPEQAVLLSDAVRLPVRFQVAGIKPGDRAQVVCELRRDGSTAARATAEAERGAQRIVLDLAGRKLLPGTYQLHASVGGRVAELLAQVRVVESPWR